MFNHKLITILLIVFFILSHVVYFSIRQTGHLYLSYALAHGSLAVGTLNINRPITYTPVSPSKDDVVQSDMVYVGGPVYYAFGPMIALMFVPIIDWIAATDTWLLAQALFSMCLTLLNGLLLYRLARLFRLDPEQSLWAVFAFFAVSPYIGIAGINLDSYSSHILATTWTLATFYEFFTHRRWWLIGLLIGFGFATRVSIGIGILFFILAALFHFTDSKHEKKTPTQSMLDLFQLLLPFSFIVLLHLIYNAARFANPFELGHSYAMIAGHLKLSRDTGLFLPSHVATNLKSMFLDVPYLAIRNGHWQFPFFRSTVTGMSIFFTSWYLLGYYRINWRDKLNLNLTFTGVIILLFLSTLFSSGFITYGYRFFLDASLFFFIPLMRALADRRFILTTWIKVLLVINAAVNLYLVLFGTIPIAITN